MNIQDWAGPAIGFASAFGGIAAAGFAAYKKMRDALGTDKNGDGSLRDLVLEIRGEVRALATRIEANTQITAVHEHRIQTLEHPWGGRTRPGLGSVPDTDAAE